MARNKFVKFNAEKFRTKARLAVGQFAKRVGRDIFDSLQELRPFIERELKKVAAKKDKHSPEISPEIRPGPYSAKESTPGRAEQLLGHNANIVHEKTGELGDSIGVSEIKRRRVVNGLATRVFVEAGYIDDPPEHAGAVSGLGDSKMFARDPFSILLTDSDFKNELVRRLRVILKRKEAQRKRR